MEYFIRNETAELWVADTGSHEAPACVLCSGGPGCCDYMEPVAQMIDDRLRVIRFEQRGCGRSTKDGLYDIKTATNDMERIREALNIETWTVGGHSWGANLALFYALAYPQRINSLIYLAGNGVQRNQEWSVAYHANLEAQGEPLPEMAHQFNPDVNRAGNASYRAYIQEPALYRRIADLDVPSLFVCAGRDIRPNWPAMQVASLMRHSALEIIEGAPHYLWVTHADELKRCLRRFVHLES